MSIIYVKLRGKGEEILEDIIRRYGDNIVAYDLERLETEVFPEDETIQGVRIVSKKGGSLSVTIPKPISKYMGLKENDELLFTARKKIGKIYIEKVRRTLKRASID